MFDHFITQGSQQAEQQKDEQSDTTSEYVLPHPRRQQSLQQHLEEQLTHLKADLSTKIDEKADKDAWHEAAAAFKASLEEANDSVSALRSKVEAKCKEMDELLPVIRQDMAALKARLDLPSGKQQTSLMQARSKEEQAQVELDEWRRLVIVPWHRMLPTLAAAISSGSEQALYTGLKVIQETGKASITNKVINNATDRLKGTALDNFTEILTEVMENKLQSPNVLRDPAASERATEQAPPTQQDQPCLGAGSM